MKAAVIQMRSGTDVAENIDAARALIRDAAGHGAQLIATPEMTTLLQRDSDKLRRDVRSEDDDVSIPAFSDLARELGVTLLIGSAPIQIEGGIVNRTVVFNPEGDITARYDKINLFEAAISKTETYREADTYLAGDHAVLVEVEAETQSWLMGLSICYDVRFPALYNGYAKAGAGIITVPAAFTRATGKAHWETLLRARAIETGAYILAPAQGGTHEDGRKTWGRSMIVDPWGDVIAKLDHDAPGILMAYLSQDKVAQARAKIPAWRQ